MQWTPLVWLSAHNSHECCSIIMTGELLMGSRTISWAQPLKLQCMYTSWWYYWNAHSDPVVLGWNSGCCISNKHTHRCRCYWVTHHTLNSKFLDNKPTTPICWAQRLLQWKQLPSLLSFTVQISVKRVTLGRLLWICSATNYGTRWTCVQWCNCPFKCPLSSSWQGTTFSVLSPWKKTLHLEFHLKHSRRCQKALWPSEIKIP